MTKKEKILELTLQGKTVEEISTIVESSKNVIRTVINRNGLKVNRYKSIMEDGELIQFLMGTLLGDGSIQKFDPRFLNSNLSIAHGNKQKEYVEWKFNFLKQYSLAPNKISHNIIKDSRMKFGEFEEYRFKSLVHPIFTKYRTIFYPNGKKIVPKIITNLTELGLAIWYMDDGSVTTYSFELSTHGFTKEDVKFLIEVLKRNFNLDCTSVLDKRSNGYKIYILSSSREHFIKLVSPYILQSFKYKLIPYYNRVLYKQGELLEHPEMGNQQPSLSSNTFEGSTTNNRVLNKDSNVDTSALQLSS